MIRPPRASSAHFGKLAFSLRRTVHGYPLGADKLWTRYSGEIVLPCVYSYSASALRSPSPDHARASWQSLMGAGVGTGGGVQEREAHDLKGDVAAFRDVRNQRAGEVCVWCRQSRASHDRLDTSTSGIIATSPGEPSTTPWRAIDVRNSHRDRPLAGPSWCQNLGTRRQGFDKV